MTYIDILNFYNRVEKAPFEFLKSLHKFIEADLYEFDDKRLEEMATEIENRMTSETAIKFATKILSRY